MERSAWIWQVDWEPRLQSAIRVRGFESVTSFLETFPGLTYRELSEVLGIPFAEVQLQFIGYRDASQRKRLAWAAQDSLCRKIREHFSDGWQSSNERAVLSAIGSWGASVTATGDLAYLGSTVDLIARSFKVNPPADGWLPQGPDDVVIQNRFAEYWPAET